MQELLDLCVFSDMVHDPTNLEPMSLKDYAKNYYKDFDTDPPVLNVDHSLLDTKVQFVKIFTNEFQIKNRNLVAI